MSFNISEPARVKLEILDISGNFINSFYQGLKSAGQHEIPVDVADYPNGAYIVRMTAGRNVFSGKLVVKR
ncbi:MAG: T9SS type A sorting domain-containing protein [Candidatus Kapabacteria bacterium]|nr:T9SS type A sorting domain-containing protein [Candidatus Kapabacteria bacterium]